MPFLDKVVRDTPTWPSAHQVVDPSPGGCWWREGSCKGPVFGSGGQGPHSCTALKEYAEKHIDDKLFEQIRGATKICPPQTKEAAVYRMHFQKRFTTDSHASTCLYTDDSIACSTARALKWHEMFESHKDPSHLSSEHEQLQTIVCL